MKKFILSNSGLRNSKSLSESVEVFPISQKEAIEESDFIFILEDKVIKMNRFLAEFISPRVPKMCNADPTINEIDLNQFFDDNQNPKPIFSSEIINIFVRSLIGYEVEIDASQSHKLRVLSILLDNEEMFVKMNQLFPITKDLSNIDTCLDYLKNFGSLKNIGLSFNLELASIIDFISSNFYQIEQEKLLNLSKSTILSIISNNHLLLNDEDSLFDFIEKLFPNNYENDSDEFNKTHFYEQINFSELSEDKYKDFFDNFNYNDMTGTIWLKISQSIFDIKRRPIRANSRRYIDGNHAYQYTNVEFNNSKSAYNGIVTHLGQGIPYNALKNGKINVFGSSHWKNFQDCDPINVIKFDDPGFCYHSDSVPNSWITYEFISCKVNPSHYSIRSDAWGPQGYYHPKSWVIEGSNDLQSDNWAVLDTRSNEISLDNRCASNTYTIQNRTNEFYRYLRIRQTDVNTHGDHCFIFSSLEYFGVIREQ